MLLPLPPPATPPQDAGLPCMILRFFGVGPTLGGSGTNSPNARLGPRNSARAFVPMQVAASGIPLWIPAAPPPVRLLLGPCEFLPVSPLAPRKCQNMATTATCIELMHQAPAWLRIQLPKEPARPPVGTTEPLKSKKTCGRLKTFGHQFTSMAVHASKVRASAP